MSTFSNRDGIKIVYNLIATIQDNKEYLSEIDGAIGDGDHGINMNKGFTKTEHKLREKNMDLTEGLKTLGMTLMTEIGGSMGPLYGTFFLRMSKVTTGEEEIKQDIFSKMLNEACDGLKNIGNAKVGDKTLMDTLIPAVEAYDKACNERKNFKESLNLMQEAAEKGKDSTKDMVAKVGRAARLGERSRGVLDAGATSCNLILQTMADSIKTII
ncbi:dihydroxyacetone kinase subunit L [Iocasia frigidifontis]|uniref:phosphoenolpyruvate--glycerone phosphotransferase n=1 Tax=Iocasia fonsfrigidae TaxID=2682810 RepID=A0A8A7KNZ9_9FIRM|nr:dihydroxyacetone kinase subunit DhaL [Iocasia fonsfrigidae]QTL99542.1 dihydroxyacetone kinase subunit L [Iocasia fonsfrigidae]